MRRTIPIIIMAVLFIVLFGVKRCLYRDIAAKKHAERVGAGVAPAAAESAVKGQPR